MKIMSCICNVVKFDLHVPCINSKHHGAWFKNKCPRARWTTSSESPIYHCLMDFPTQRGKDQNAEIHRGMKK